jgi:hypothetical protein
MDQRRRVGAVDRRMDKELARYIIGYFSHLMTEKESRALRHLTTKEKLALSNHHSNDQAKEQRIKVFKEKGLLIDDVEVLALLKNGNTEFVNRTAERILNDNKDRIQINNCPHCGKLARTPYARQCRHCEHSWR